MIHPSAICEPGAVIGEGTKIWHFCHVMAGATIGRNCVLGQGCFVASTAKVGSGVRLQNNVSVFDGVVLQDYVFCGPSVVFTNVRVPRAEISRRGSYETTVVERGASLGANSTIRCGVHIGRYAMVGAGTVVVKDVPPFALIVGNPGVQVGWVGRAGQRLQFDVHGHAHCAETEHEYRLVHGRVEEVVPAPR